MIWNATTLGQVRGLRVRLGLDASWLLHDRDEAILQAKRRIGDELVRMAEPYGAVIDLRDVEFIERDDKPYGLLIQARWFPAHGIVELLGGPRDGDVMEVQPQVIGQPLLFPMLLDPVGYLDGGKLDPVPTRNLEYRPAGWREETRSWIYRYYL